MPADISVRDVVKKICGDYKPFFCPGREVPISSRNCSNCQENHGLSTDLLNSRVADLTADDAQSRLPDRYRGQEGPDAIFPRLICSSMRILNAS